MRDKRSRIEKDTMLRLGKEVLLRFSSSVVARESSEEAFKSFLNFESRSKSSKNVHGPSFIALISGAVKPY